MQREPGQCKIILLFIVYIHVFIYIWFYISLYVYIYIYIYMFMYIYIWIYGYTFGAHWFVHKVAGLETSWNHRMGSMRAGMQIVHVWVPHQLAQKNLAWESACPRMSLRELRNKTHVCCNLSFKIFKLTQWINVSNNRPPWIFGDISQNLSISNIFNLRKATSSCPNEALSRKKWHHIYKYIIVI